MCSVTGLLLSIITLCTFIDFDRFQFNISVDNEIKWGLETESICALVYVNMNVPFNFA